jgi:SAM-dependent methyltransferase
VTEWFEQWFGEEYLRLYPHRDDADAAAVVSLISGVVPLTGRRVLDLGCGPGRHAAQLTVSGARVTGFDLSPALLHRAQRRPERPAHLVRGDMRLLPFRPGTFDVVVNLFTSFGYFADDEQHHEVLAGSATLLAPEGVFVLDYLNAHRIRTELVPRESLATGTQSVVIERHITDDERYVVKEIHLMGEGRSFVERVRLFTPAELEELLDGAGLRVIHRYGDYHGGPLGNRAPRAIFVASRS